MDTMRTTTVSFSFSERILAPIKNERKTRLKICNVCQLGQFILCEYYEIRTCILIGHKSCYPKAIDELEFFYFHHEQYVIISHTMLYIMEVLYNMAMWLKTTYPKYIYTVKCNIPDLDRIYINLGNLPIYVNVNIR